MPEVIHKYQVILNHWMFLLLVLRVFLQYRDNKYRNLGILHNPLGHTANHKIIEASTPS